MNVKSIAAAVAVVVICAGLAFADPRKPMPAPVVVVNVVVDPSGAVHCEPDVAHVNKANTLVVFQLVGDGFVFAEQNAIEISAGGADFPLASWTLSPTEVSIVDARLSRNTSFKYTVNLINTATGQPFAYDPTIQNDPD